MKQIICLKGKFFLPLVICHGGPDQRSPWANFGPQALVWASSVYISACLLMFKTFCFAIQIKQVF